MKREIKKLAVASILVAITLVFSTFYIPVGAAKCYPVQHIVNVLAAVFLGPLYGVTMAFSTSVIRNIMGTGSVLAFPGSMVGAFLSGWLYKTFNRVAFAYAGEIIGTGIIGAVIGYPVATLLMGKEATMFMYVIPFLLSTVAGTGIAFFIISAFYKSNVMDYLKNMIDS